jgi:hypothetical protein
MSLFNTANHYNVYLDIPDQLSFSWNNIYDYSANDLLNFIKTLNIKDEHSLIVLWGIGHKIDINDSRFNVLNEWYQSIKNPMILFNNTIYINSPGVLKFPYQQVEFFQYLSKLSVESISSPINKNKKFFFASTKDYLSRRYILQSLFNNGFNDQGYIAYKCIDKHHTTELYDIDNLQLIQSAAASIDHLLPIQGFDDTIEYVNIPKNITSDAYLSIVTETFYNGPELFFSEKIFNSMLYNHFFVYLGPAHSLKYLRSKGFKTWAHIINESYDDIENSAERLYAVTNAINEFVAKPINEIEQLYAENIDIINHNKNLVLATDINNTIVSAMQQAIAIKN